MSHAKPGDTVRIHYTAKLEDGTVTDTSAGREPLEFTVGAGRVLPGVEQAVTGMSPGESKSARIPSEQAYGAHNDKLVTAVDRQRLPDDLNPFVGQALAVRQQDGHEYTATVTEVSDTSVTIDANHKLAGKDLVFDLELVEVL